MYACCDADDGDQLHRDDERGDQNATSGGGEKSYGEYFYVCGMPSHSPINIKSRFNFLAPFRLATAALIVID